MEVKPDFTKELNEYQIPKHTPEQEAAIKLEAEKNDPDKKS